MKFSYKILLCSIIIMAAAFGIGGYFFVNNVFETSMEREVGQAMDESNILQFAFETAALNVPSKYGILQNSTIEEIGSNLEKRGQETGRLIRLSDEDKNILYVSDGFVEETDLLSAMEEQTRMYKVIDFDNHYYVQTGTVVNALDRIIYLETMRDITEVYDERTRGFAVYRHLTLIMLVFSSVVMFFISSWLTKPIRLLTRATERMTAGDYSYRAKQISNDEMGRLTEDFNNMAQALENNINELENEVRAREDFIAAFSHELKTPLTSIIGYADLLRSRKLDDEKHFLSANYIYTEGKRLENMSLRLLDIIVTKRLEVEKQEVRTEVLFEYIRNMFANREDIKVEVSYEDCRINVESNFIKTVLLNLVDNACKASEKGARVEVSGRKVMDGFLFSVRDYGVGINKDECKRITEAFYMVDKSRARSMNGAGLGLSLCSEILKLHESVLNIESTPGEGSTFSFIIPDIREPEVLKA